MILYYRILEFRSTKRLIAAHSLVEWATIDRNAGDQSVGATLVPIPNTIVKPYSADGTPPERARESRPSPAPRSKPPSFVTGASSFPPPRSRRRRRRRPLVLRFLRSASS